jgi:CxxC motif-containing protein (DUF1111 family)
MRFSRVKRSLTRSLQRFSLVLLAIFAGLALSAQLSQAAPAVQRAGGDTTVDNRSSHGLSQPAANLSAADLAQHVAGDRAFSATFVSAPAPLNAGLGPTFNNSSCLACHVRDARGVAAKGNLLVRVSLPVEGRSATIAPAAPWDNTPPVPGIGTQIQDQAIYGHQPKAKVAIGWQPQPGTYGDGTPYSLRAPRLQITLPDGSPLPTNVLTSARVAPPIGGRGLLEAIPEATIAALADPEDRNHDGISGKMNRVWDVRQKALVLGRFGVKANSPNLIQQNAAAYVNDMGVTNPLFPEPDGSSDIDLKTLEAATFYTQTLAVPARTMVDDAGVIRGERLFSAANCAACHIATLNTGSHPVQAIANQTIHPYSDLLLHDLGPGLADGRPDFAATGQEWRTAPLWGLGLAKTVLPTAGYLHDGRARTIAEAILWHGGEAEPAMQAFRGMDGADRQSLIRFLNAL